MRSLILDLIFSSLLDQNFKLLQLILIFFFALLVQIDDIPDLVGQAELDFATVHQMSEKQLNVAGLIQDLDDVELLVDAFFALRVQPLKLVPLAPIAKLFARWPIEPIVEE